MHRPDQQWPTVVSIVGPTASGKSSLALQIADLMPAEIVNADAFQVYRDMDIGTAKPGKQDRDRVPHHLFDILDITADLSAAQYQGLGRAVLRAIAGRRGIAVVVGGSGLYVRGLLDDLRFPGSDPTIRARWEARLVADGPEALHATLASRDPEAARRILPTNGRRVVRALEVGELTGQPFVAELPVAGPRLVPHISIGVQLDRDVVDARIEERVDAMIERGWVAEAHSLMQRGLADTPTAGRALGYRQMMSVACGQTSLSEARDDIVSATRRYARRQIRWFRRDPRTTWVPPERALSTVVDELARRGVGPRTLCP